MLLKLAWKLPAPMSLDGTVCGEGRDGGQGWRGRMEGKGWKERMEGRDGREAWRGRMEGRDRGQGWSSHCPWVEGMSISGGHTTH